jgi:hypothetical protein
MKYNRFIHLKINKKLTVMPRLKKISHNILNNHCASGYSRGTCIPMFIAALFTIAKLWKQPRCPPTDQWIKEMWYLYTMEFYAAMRKNKMLSFAGKWMELEDIILSEVSLAQKTKNHMFSLICGH